MDIEELVKNYKPRQIAPQQAPAQQPQKQGVGGVAGFALDILPFGRVAEKAITGRGNQISAGELFFELATALPLGRIAKAGKFGKTAAKATKGLDVLGDTAKAGSAATRIGRQKIASTGLEEAISATEAGRNLYTQDRINKAAQTVFKRFKAKTPRGLAREVSSVRNVILDERDSLLKDVASTVNNKTLRSSITSQVGKFGLTKTDARKVSEILTRNIPDLTKKKSFSALELSKIQRKLNSNIKSTVFEGVAPNRSEDLILAIKEGVDDALTKIVPKERKVALKQLNGELSDLFLVNKVGSAAGKGSASVGFIGLPKNALRGAQRLSAESAESLMGRRVTLPGQLAQFGVAEAGSGISQALQQQNMAQQIPQDMVSDLSGALAPTTAQTGMQQQPMEQPQSRLTQEQINQAILLDMAETGGANVEQIQMIAEMYGPQATSAEPNITKVTAQQYGLAQTGLQSLEQLAGLLQQDPGVLDRTRTPGRGTNVLGIGGTISNLAGTSEFDTYAYNIADTLLRLRTGAQANESEVRKLQTQIMPRAGDSPETVQIKLMQLQEAFASILNIAQNQGAAEPIVGVAQ